MMKVMSILPMPIQGGAEHAALHLIEHFEKEHQLVVLLVGKKAHTEFLEIDLHLSNCEFIDCRSKSNNRFRLIFHLSSIMKISLAIKKSSPDIVLSHLSVINIWTFFATLFNRNQNLVVVEHTPHLPAFPYSLFAPAVWKRARVIAPSPVIVDYIFEKSGIESRLIRNPVKLQSKREFTQNFRPEGYDFKLLAVGRLAPVKNYGFLFETMNLLSEDFHLDIFGAGDASELIKKLNIPISEHVCFKGQIEQDELLAQLHNYDALLITSDREGDPTVVYQAAFAEVPIVGRSTPGLLQAISRVGGWLPDQDTPFHLAESLRKAIRIGKNRISVEDWSVEYSIEIASHRYCKVFQEIVDSNANS